MYIEEIIIVKFSTDFFCYLKIVRSWAPIGKQRLGWNVFKGVSNALQKKKWRPIEGGGVSTSLWRMPHGDAQRPSAAPPSTNLRSSIGDTGRRRRLLRSSFHLRVRVCAKVFLTTVSFLLLCRTTTVRLFWTGTTTKRTFSIVTFFCSFPIILVCLPFLSRRNVFFTSFEISSQD